MEPWRTLATALMTVVGGLLVLSMMSKVRDNRHRHGGDVIRTGMRGLFVLAMVNMLVATVLPATLCWALLAASVFVSSVLMVTG